MTSCPERLWRSDSGRFPEGFFGRGRAIRLKERNFQRSLDMRVVGCNARNIEKPGTCVARVEPIPVKKVLHLEDKEVQTERFVTEESVLLVEKNEEIRKLKIKLQRLDNENKQLREQLSRVTVTENFASSILNIEKNVEKLLHLQNIDQQQQQGNVSNHRDSTMIKIAKVYNDDDFIDKAIQELNPEKRLKNIILRYWTKEQYARVGSRRPEGVQPKDHIKIRIKVCQNIINVANELNKDDDKALRGNYAFNNKKMEARAEINTEHEEEEDL